MKFLMLLKSLLLIYLLLCGVFYWLQRQLIYHPMAATQHDFDQVQITTADAVVEAIVTHEGAEHAIIYFGGNAENVAYTAQDFWHEMIDHSTYLLKYRGYAGATGTATEANLYADALALYDQVKSKHTKVTVIGRSLGSGVATYLASHRSIDKLVLVTPFDSLRSVAMNMLPVFPVKLLLKDPYDSSSRVKSIKTPTLIIMATNDRVIPNVHSKTLYLTFPKDQAQLQSIQAGHNDLDLDPNYFRILKAFINSL